MQSSEHYSSINYMASISLWRNPIKYRHILLLNDSTKAHYLKILHKRTFTQEMMISNMKVPFVYSLSTYSTQITGRLQAYLSLLQLTTTRTNYAFYYLLNTKFIGSRWDVCRLSSQGLLQARTIRRICGNVIAFQNPKYLRETKWTRYKFTKRSQLTFCSERVT